MKVPRRAQFAFLVVMLFTAEPALAQQNERRGFIGLGIGPSAPLGSFGDASSTNKRGGRAPVLRRIVQVGRSERLPSADLGIRHCVSALVVMPHKVSSDT